jgi:hypothetical protein
MAAANIEIRLDPETKEAFADLARAINAKLKSQERIIERLRDMVRRLESPTMYRTTTFAIDEEDELEQGRLDYAAMQRALDDRHNQIRGYQHDCNRYRSRIGELEEKLHRVEILTYRWEDHEFPLARDLKRALEGER